MPEHLKILSEAVPRTEMPRNSLQVKGGDGSSITLFGGAGMRGNETTFPVISKLSVKSSATNDQQPKDQAMASILGTCSQCITCKGCS